MQAEQIKNEVRQLEQLSNELDRIKHQFMLQNKKVLALVKQHNLVKAKFDFGSKVVRYKHDQSFGSITQDSIRKTLASKYNTIDPKQFIEDVKMQRKRRDSERMEITTKTK